MIQNILKTPSQVNNQIQELATQRKEHQTGYSAALVTNETKPREDRVNISQEAQSRFQDQKRQQEK
jgi:hypothetical protein